MLLIHLLRCLSLNLNTWCISVEEEAVDIDLSRTSVIKF